MIIVKIDIEKMAIFGRFKNAFVQDFEIITLLARRAKGSKLSFEFFTEFFLISQFVINIKTIIPSNSYKMNRQSTVVLYFI